MLLSWYFYFLRTVASARQRIPLLPGRSCRRRQAVTEEERRYLMGRQQHRQKDPDQPAHHPSSCLHSLFISPFLFRPCFASATFPPGEGVASLL